MRIWVTRAEPGASETAARLTARGLSPLVDPVIEIRPLPAAPDPGAAEALAFTSRAGVRAWAALSADRSLPVFAVGDATAEAARAAGWRFVRSAGGDGAALAALLATDGPLIVLHPCAAERAFDLAAALAPLGRTVEARPVYESVPRPSPAALAEIERLDAVLIHSPKAGRLTAERLAELGARPAVFAISETAARPLRAAGCEKVRAAPFPDEAALLNMLPRTSGPTHERP